VPFINIEASSEGKERRKKGRERREGRGGGGVKHCMYVLWVEVKGTFVFAGGRFCLFWAF